MNHGIRYPLWRRCIGKCDSWSITRDAEPSTSEMGSFDAYEVELAVRGAPRLDRDGSCPTVVHHRGDTLEKHAPPSTSNGLIRVGLKGDDGSNNCGVEFRTRRCSEEHGILKKREMHRQDYRKGIDTGTDATDRGSAQVLQAL